VGRPKKFRNPKNVTFTVEKSEHRALQIKAAQMGKSLSDLLHALALSLIKDNK
jgi:predicted HicB family RNase H-like nuclease